MSQLSPDRRPLKVGYVLKKYPRLSETFILDEILGVEQAGVTVDIYSLRLPDDGRFHADLARVKAGATYVAPVWSLNVLSAFEALRDAGIEGRDGLAPALAFLKNLPEEDQAPLLVQALHLSDLVTRNMVDHLHAHFMTVAAHCAYVAHLFTGVSFSVTAHAKDIYRRTVNRGVFKQVAEAATAVITVCEANRRHITEHLLGPQDVDVIYNGIALDNFSAEVRPRDPGLVLGVGRLVEKKGYHVLLEAAAILRDRGVDFHCVLIGDGEQANHLRQQRRRLGLEDRVDMPGARPRDEVIRWMRKARVLAAPCVNGSDGNQDALPTVLLEALASGLPAVSTPIGGVPEILDSGVEGCLVPDGNPAALAEALERLLADNQLWDRMSTAGPLKASLRFDRNKTVPQLIEVFRRSTRPTSLEAVP